MPKPPSLSQHPDLTVVNEAAFQTDTGIDSRTAHMEHYGLTPHSAGRLEGQAFSPAVRLSTSQRFEGMTHISHSHVR